MPFSRFGVSAFLVMSSEYSNNTYFVSNNQLPPATKINWQSFGVIPDIFSTFLAVIFGSRCLQPCTDAGSRFSELQQHAAQHDSQGNHRSKQCRNKAHHRTILGLAVQTKHLGTIPDPAQICSSNHVKFQRSNWMWEKSFIKYFLPGTEIRIYTANWRRS